MTESPNLIIMIQLKYPTQHIKKISIQSVTTLIRASVHAVSLTMKLNSNLLAHTLIYSLSPTPANSISTGGGETPYQAPSEGVKL